MASCWAMRCASPLLHFVSSAAIFPVMLFMVEFSARLEYPVIHSGACVLLRFAGRPALWLLSPEELSDATLQALVLEPTLLFMTSALNWRKLFLSLVEPLLPETGNPLSAKLP